MRKIALGFMILLVITGVSFGETVMLYVGSGPENRAEFDLCIPISAALEDGVMSEFFDSGHIIFNAGLKSAVRFPEPPGSHERLPLRIAKAGGASYLLEVELNYSVPDGEDGPKDFYADFVFSHVNSSKVLQQGELSSQAAERNIETPDPEEKGYVLGTMIAQETLAVW